MPFAVCSLFVLCYLSRWRTMVLLWPLNKLWKLLERISVLCVLMEGWTILVGVLLNAWWSIAKTTRTSMKSLLSSMIVELQSLRLSPLECWKSGILSSPHTVNAKSMFLCTNTRKFWRSHNSLNTSENLLSASKDLTEQSKRTVGWQCIATNWIPETVKTTTSLQCSISQAKRAKLSLSEIWRRGIRSLLFPFSLTKDAQISTSKWQTSPKNSKLKCTPSSRPSDISQSSAILFC